MKYDNVCADYYGINNNSDKDDDDNDDTKNDYCRFCGHPEDHCTCKYVVSNGSNNGEYGGFGGNVGSEGSDFIGGNNSGFRKQISVAELKSKWNVKLVSSINLPDKLHPQTKPMECVIRAFCFMSELKGNDYATAYEVLTKIAIEKDYHLDDYRKGGIPLCDAITVFDSYCELAHGNYDENTIESCIDNNIAVALVSLDDPPHMVTVIGYDDNFYYTAAGEANGNVTVYSKNALMGSGYIYFNNIKVPYRCKRYEIY